MRLEGAILKIDIDDIISSILDEGENTELLQSISCHGLVIKNVADQLIDGQTEDNFCGSEYILSENLTMLQEARQRIAKSSSDVASREIERLQRTVEYQAKQIRELNKELYKK